MPLFRNSEQTTFDRAKAYAVANKLDYFEAYHLLKWAKEQDGVPVGTLHPDMPELSALPSDVQSRVGAAKTALSA